MYLEKLLGSERMHIVHVTVLRCFIVNLEREHEEARKRLLILDLPYAAQFRLLASSSGEKKSACN
jgi:hypothetical protein